MDKIVNKTVVPKTVHCTVYFRCAGERGEEVVLQAGPLDGWYRGERFVANDTCGMQGARIRLEQDGKFTLPDDRYVQTDFFASNELGSGIRFLALEAGKKMVLCVRFHEDRSFDATFSGRKAPLTEDGGWVEFHAQEVERKVFRIEKEGTK